jgi:CheY-like chemotaxis protein
MITPYSFKVDELILFFSQKVMERILHHCQKKVTTVSNGLEAVELIQNSPHGHFDLIFMDVNMPIMDGIKATEEIRNIEMQRSRGTIPSSSPPPYLSVAAPVGDPRTDYGCVCSERDGHGIPSLSTPNCTTAIPNVVSNGSATAKDRPPRMTIIGISGNARDQSIQVALDSGMDGYITKPWKKEDIYRAIGYVV